MDYFISMNTSLCINTGSRGRRQDGSVLWCWPVFGCNSLCGQLKNNWNNSLAHLIICIHMQICVCRDYQKCVSLIILTSQVAVLARTSTDDSRSPETLAVTPEAKCSSDDYFWFLIYFLFFCHSALHWWHMTGSCNIWNVHCHDCWHC